MEPEGLTDRDRIRGMGIVDVPAATHDARTGDAAVAVELHMSLGR